MPVRAREALRQMFDWGRLILRPQAEGYCMAESRFFPLAMLRLDAEPSGRAPRRRLGTKAAGPHAVRLVVQQSLRGGDTRAEYRDLVGVRETHRRASI